MNLEKLKNLQKNLLGTISLIITEDSEEEISNMQDQALKIIDELRDHINDDIEINNNLKMTILDCIVFCDSQGSVRLNNKSLLDLEDAVKSIGGKTSQELGRVRETTGQMGNLGLAEFFEQSAAFMREQEALIGARAERISMDINSIAIFHLTALGANFGERQAQRVGQIVGATLGGLLSVPIMAMLSAAVASVFVGRGSGHITLREITQEIVHSISEPMAGLSAALAGGMTILLRSPSGINMEFGESLRSGLIAAIGAGTGAALSTALVRRALADRLPIPANLEDVATEQPNMQGQNI